MAKETISEDRAATRAGGEAPSECAFERPGDPCLIVIFGATGDLVARKLLPALLTLASENGLPEPFAVVGVSRHEMADEALRDKLRREVGEHAARRLAEFDRLSGAIRSARVEIDDPGSYEELANRLRRLHAELGTAGNTLFYLAVPPKAYEPIARGLGAAGLSREHEQGNGWIRLVVEKPFGHDLESAMALDATLHQHFGEHQIFRIDHYLAKETVQNMMALRFANAIFEPIWNRNYIQSVSITAAESLGVGHRADYYDHTGVLRDMFQNHMMQLLALCAMEAPSIYAGERIRDEKTKVYRSLRPFPLGRMDDYLVLGQYASGVVNDEKVPAYVDEDGVSPDSQIPTYATLKLFIDNWRWQGVPFYLTSGKRMAAKHTEIKVRFKEVPYSMFRHVLGEHISSNTLILGIQPREEVTLSFQAKTPGSKMCLRTVRMNFDYASGGYRTELDAYEKVLIDTMLGDHTLFWRQDSVNLCWGYLTPILEACEKPGLSERLYLYKAGSNGPQQVRRVLPRGYGDGV